MGNLTNFDEKEFNELCKIKNVDSTKLIKWIEKGLDKEKIIHYHIGILSPIELPTVIMAIMFITNKYIHGFDIRDNNILTHVMHNFDNFAYLGEAVMQNGKHLYFSTKYGAPAQILLSDINERIDKLDEFLRNFRNIVWGE